MGDDKKKDDQRQKRWSTLELILGSFSALLLVALILLTCVDVIGRYFFNSPVNGAFELTQMMLATLIFTALPLTTASGEHVDVELITQMMSAKSQKVFSILGWVSTALVMAILSWRLWKHALRLAHDGAVSNSLSLPISPIGFFASIACGVCFIIALVRIYQKLNHKIVD